MSGGVISKIKTIQLSNFMLSRIDAIDNFLIRIAPSIFGMGRSIVLKKI
mgnify:FL=1